MLRFFKFYRKIISFKLAETTMFRGSFWLLFIWLFIDALVKIIFFSAIFTHVETIGGWTFADTLFLIFFLGVTWDFAWTFYLSGLDSFVESFTRGSFDFILIKPMHSLVYITLTGLDPFAFSISRFLILFYIIIFVPFAWFWQNILVTIIIFILVHFILHALYVMVASLAFWVMEAWSIFGFMSHVVEGARFPISIYSQVGRFLFTFIFPIILIANYPTMVLKGMLSFNVIWQVLAIALVFQLLAYVVWNLGVKRYTSASS